MLPFLSCIPRDRITGSYQNSIFDFEKLQGYSDIYHFIIYVKKFMGIFQNGG
jgi:hypothetical protein